MIDTLIEKIREAEARAAKIVTDAHAEAAEIAKNAQAEIDSIKNSAVEEIAKRIRANNPQAQDIGITTTADSIIVDEAVIKKTKKYITDEFHKRYTA